MCKTNLQCKKVILNAPQRKKKRTDPNFSFDFQIKPYLLILKKLNTFEPSLNVINIDTHTMQNVFSFYPSDIWTEFEKMYRVYSLV